MPHDLPDSSRRRFLLGALGGTALAALGGCLAVQLGDDSDSGDSDVDPTPGSVDEWASGGTGAMVDQESYPDPFAAGVASCTLICQTTEGPCTTEDAPERQDISEGLGGLPVRLALKIVDESCTPIAGAKVEIWHTQRTGVYSGETPNPGMCSGDDEEAISADYFRGTQTTDAAGRVNFDTCFPGWYAGRVVHIHFRVTLGGSDYVVSQLFFDEALTSEIFATHPEYEEFGQPDTDLASDSVVGGEDDLSNYLLTVERMTDGAMLASKLITIRSSLSNSICAVSGGAGGPGGPP